MGILKWYSIIIIALNLLFSLIFIIGDDELSKRISMLINILINIPILIYLIKI